MTVSLPACGELFEGRYQLEDVLGEGGFARVYRATDTVVDRAVALKVLRPRDGGYDGQIAARFMREAKGVAQLTGPHTVKMFKYGRTDAGLLFMVFELVPGADLKSLLAGGPIDERSTAHIVRQVVLALREAHAAGLLHRDIKPDNIRVFEYGDDPLRVKLLDFGIAKSLDADASLTATGKVVGTPRFMSPEQLFGKPLSPASDLYSVGLVAFEMLTGRPSDHVKALANGEPVGLRQSDGASPSVRRLVNRLLATEPTERFRSAAEVLEALEALDYDDAPPDEIETIDERPTTPLAAPPLPEASEEAAGAATGRPRLAAIAIIVVALAVIVAVVWRTRRPTSPAGRQLRVPAALTRVSASHATPAEPTVAPVPADAGVDATASTTHARRTHGCGLKPPFVGEQPMAAQDRLRRVSWMVHVPRGYDPEVAHPVIMLFHDSASSPQEILSRTSLGALADREQFIIIAPRSKDVLYSWSADIDLDDAYFAFDATSESLCIDPTRVYAVGHGGGGVAADRLSCSGWIAAIALTSYVPRQARFRCEQTRPIPALFVGPTKTNFMPVDGGRDCAGFPTASFDTYEQLWRTRNHCGEHARTFLRHKGSRCRMWDCGETPFASCRVNGGRPWPGSGLRSTDILHCDGEAADFPQNETIWNFFESLQPEPVPQPEVVAPATER